MRTPAILANSAPKSSHSTEASESPQMQEIRDALGAVAAAVPAVFWLYQGESGEWHVRREGDAEDCSFPDRETAIQAARIAAVRCTSYCMFLQDLTGRFDRECFNWVPPQSSSE